MDGRTDATGPVVLMGVTGVGKSTVGAELARLLDRRFVEGDDYHPAANVSRMASGAPLDDDDRRPWLEALAAELERWRAEGTAVVLACSALRRGYRDMLRRADSSGQLVLLTASADLLRWRLARRRGHYMPATLLDSQLDALEPPRSDEQVLVIEVMPSEPPVLVAERVLAALGQG